MIKNLHMTDLTSFQDCRKKFYFDKLLRIARVAHNNELDIEKTKQLSPETDPEFPMTFGTIGHLVLKDYYANKRPLLESFQEHGKNLRADFYEIGESIFYEYEKEYQDDFDKYRILLVETPIEVAFKDINGNEQVIELNIDLVLQSVDNGAVYAMDHKFYASMPNVNELMMRDQFTGYVASVRKTGQDISGLIVNILCKRKVNFPKILESSGKISKDKTQSTTYHRYKAVVDLHKMNGADVSEYDDMLEFLRTSPHPSLRRTIIHKTKTETATWEDNLKYRLHDISKAVEGGDKYFYPSPGRQCLSCQFSSICISQLQGGSGQGYMETMYRKKEETER